MRSMRGGERIFNRQVITLLIISVSYGFDFMMFLSVAPRLVDAAGGGSVAGLVTSVLLATAVTTRLLYPFVQDRLSGRTIGLLCLGLMLFGDLLLHVINTDPGVMFLAAILRGMGFGAVTILIQGMVVSYCTPSTRGRVVATIGIATTISGVLGPFIGLTLLDRGWLAGPGTVAATVELLSMGLLLTLRPPAQPEGGPVKRPKWDTIWHAVSVPTVRFNVLTLMLASIAWAGVATFIPLILGPDSVLPSSLFLLIYFSCSAATRWTCGQLQDRRGVGSVTLVPAVLGVATAMIVLTLAESTAGAVVAAVLVGISMGWIHNVTYYAVVSHTQYSPYVLAGTWTNGVDTGGLMGTVILSIVAVSLGTDFIPLAVAAVACTALIPIVLLLRRQREPEPAA